MSQSQFVASGNALDYTPNADVDAGDVIVIGTVVGTAINDIKQGVLGAVQIEGILKMPKPSGAISAGTNCYWDDDADSILGSASGAVSLDPQDGPLAGFAAADAATNDPYVRVKLTPTGEDN